MIYLRNLKNDDKLFLPIEIIDLILFRYICKLKIKIDDKCIIRRKINGIMKEQQVNIDNIYINNNRLIFSIIMVFLDIMKGFVK